MIYTQQFAGFQPEQPQRRYYKRIDVQSQQALIDAVLPKQPNQRKHTVILPHLDLFTSISVGKECI